MEKLSIIRFNDDNHAERIWADGIFIGTLSDIESVFENLIDIINKKGNIDGIKPVLIYVCDDFEDYDEEDEIVDDIWCWFNEVEKMTKKQMDLVHKKDWTNLLKSIKENSL